jgi:uncharacterized membrane protein YfcA
MELLGYIALASMGITLGVMGAGGSILTIPILLYLLDVPIILATRYSLVMVGSTAFIGLLRYRHHILFRKAVLFLIPSVLGVFAARQFIIPALPHTLWSLPVDKALIILFIFFISVAGYFMIKNSPLVAQNHLPNNKNIKIILIGLTSGIVMGILGAGGGFLIIPTLILLMGFTMQKAVPTSLFIITVNAFIGFAADQHHLIARDWSNLAKYLVPAILGMLIGIYIAKFVNGESLKKVFGYFVLVVGLVILIKEFIL